MVPPRPTCRCRRMRRGCHRRCRCRRRGTGTDSVWWAHADLPPTAVAPKVARRLVAELLLAWDQPHLDTLADDALLVVSELVTNAVVHAGADSGVLHLDIRTDQNGSLHVGVSDGSSIPPFVKEPTGDAEGGHGLPIVTQLSARWGVESTDTGGKRVWVELH
jgi:anti-sigma regulatory factor (Ser/Thr protein kinase)